MKQWYEALFDDYGQKYDNESFTQGTVGECDIIEAYFSKKVFRRMIADDRT